MVASAYGPGKPVPVYSDDDLEAAYAAIDLAGKSPTLLAREIAGAIAGARKAGGETVLEAVMKVFESDECRATYRVVAGSPPEYTEVPCVEVPVAELQAAYDKAQAALEVK